MNNYLTPKLEQLYGKDAIYALTGVATVFAYENGEKTENQSGFKYSVVEVKTLDSLIVKVETTSKKPIFNQEQIDQATERGERIFVSFTNGRCRYYSTRESSFVEVSIIADSIELSEETKDMF